MEVFQADTPAVGDRDLLRIKSVAELKQMCRERSLPLSGNKDALVERLVDAPLLSVSVISRLMQKWFI
jgi:hypothetical protein